MINKIVAQEEALKCFLCHDAPCSKACPSQSNPGKFLQAVRFMDFAGAKTIAQNSKPSSATCAFSCKGSRLCEKACVRNKIDSPVQIQKVHQFIIQQECEPSIGKEGGNL